MPDLSPLAWSAIALAVYWLICAFAASYCSHVRGRPSMEGFWLGLLLGPAGVIAAACLPGRESDPSASGPEEPDRPARVDPTAIARGSSRGEFPPVDLGQGRRGKPLRELGE
jgi:hypothetical protein